MDQVCTRCGLPCSEPGARFCPSCGGLLQPRAAAVAPSEVVPAAPVAPPSPPARALPQVDPQVAAAIAGAMCALHPLVPARDICSRCGNFVCETCEQLNDLGKPVCSACAVRVGLDHWDVPWERRGELGLFRAYWETFKSASFAPQRAFGGLSPHGNVWDALSYAIMSTLFATSGVVVLYALIGGVVGGIALFGESTSKSDLGTAGLVVLGVVAALAILIPVVGIARAFVGAGIDHLALMLFGGGKQGYYATFRTYCYGLAPSFFGVIPFCGGYVVEIWRIVVTIIGYKQVHKMDGGRAAAAVLIPYGLCCGLYMLVIFGAQLAGAMAH